MAPLCTSEYPLWFRHWETEQSLSPFTKKWCGFSFLYLLSDSLGKRKIVSLAFRDSRIMKQIISFPPPLPLLFPLLPLSFLCPPHTLCILCVSLLSICFWYYGDLTAEGCNYVCIIFRWRLVKTNTVSLTLMLAVNTGIESW